MRTKIKTDRADPIAKTDRADPVAKTDRADPIAKTEPAATDSSGNGSAAKIEYRYVMPIEGGTGATKTDNGAAVVENATKTDNGAAVFVENGTKTDRADPIAKTDKGRERIVEIDFTRCDLIKKIYSQYITTYNTALNLSLHMERLEKKRIKRIVVKSIYRDVRRARSLEKKIAWQNLPRRYKVKRIVIIISILILLLFLFFSLI